MCACVWCVCMCVVCVCMCVVCVHVCGVCACVWCVCMCVVCVHVCGVCACVSACKQEHITRCGHNTGMDTSISQNTYAARMLFQISVLNRHIGKE